MPGFRRECRATSRDSYVRTYLEVSAIRRAAETGDEAGGRVVGDNQAMIELRTERLLLRQWRDDDVDALAPMYADPEVMRYIRDGSVLSREETAAHVDRMRQHWAEHGHGLFAAELLATGELTGWVGLAVPLFLPEVLPAVEIGWRLGRSFWGAGLATEGARAALRFGLVDQGLGRLVSIRHVDNVRSARVMEKIGLTFDRRTTVPGNGSTVDVFAITREEYDRRHDSADR
ncbi:Protein N-acetyltransferase, RimJ/RimL family [Actinoplanes philippinensis]|uniref:Protein N-acetyltransferase, RimJ/RimL family n=2 Tax=Actinoplanes philippinensis TaxID=35752 RepID=A0A1I2ENG4_9ACTN|nr:Protein N-acetyltransferase, RimJ/RimL family [Actinoplanes philippinensis]